MITRDIEKKVLELARKFPVVSITGPRQSGKSTLVKSLFSDYAYVSLEDPDWREFAKEDPRGLFARLGRKIVIDEAQRVPSLFSYIQGIVDEDNKPGQFIVSGSQNFLLLQAINQSLAGRVAIFNLLPFSAHELIHARLFPKTLNEFLFTGGYPRIYDVKISPKDYYPSFIQTYIERDVRQVSKIGKLTEFQRLLSLCATRNASILNIQGLSKDCAVSVNTIKEWISLFESSFLVQRLQPYYRNIGKRLIKTPKLYFRDTGLVCSLAGLESPDEIDFSNQKGGLFETAVIEEISKKYYARGQNPKLYFYRDSNGREIDILIEKGINLSWAIEVKSSSTYSPRFFHHLDAVCDNLGVEKNKRVVIYAGNESFDTSHGHVCAFNDLYKLDF